MRSQWVVLCLCLSLLIPSSGYAFVGDLISNEDALVVEDEFQIPSGDVIEVPVLEVEPLKQKPVFDKVTTSASLFFYKDGNEIVPVVDTSTFFKDFRALSMWPLQGIVTSQYGVRRGGKKVVATKGKRRVKLFYSRHHAGVDIAAPIGSPIVSPSEAVVAFVGLKGGYGKTVILDHGKGVTTLYGHNSEIYVDAGEKVKAGELISRVGMTGHSTGPHLHFEIRQGGKAVNPMNYIKGLPVPEESIRTAQYKTY
ncbi:MAG: M23 family metallopeptidase [Deltaproteobacteria bacterium]|nr:M23 family metallopeptidase [Deltaproteobacteria bacterium]